MNHLRLWRWLVGLPTWLRIGINAAVVIALYFIDYLTGSEISFSIFYLVPIALVAAAAGSIGVIVISLLSGVAWVSADIMAGAHYSHLAIPAWNTVMRVMIFLLVGRLIVQLIQTRDTARRAEAAAVAATAAKTDFLANLSHEIRTPLNAMLGAAELLGETPLSGPQRQYSEIFQAEGDHLLRLINDILDLSKVEAGKLKLEPAPFHLGELARSLIQTFTPRASGKELQLELAIQAAADRAWLGDAHRLRQVLSNLLSNGIKFTEQGRVLLSIAPAADGADLAFTVADTGVGIAAADQAALFRRFEQVGAAADSTGGTGLGLSITRALVETMGGRIDVESSVGHGTTFRFTLPLAPAEAGAAVAVEPAPKETPALPAGTSILLAEDYTSNQRVFAAFLRELGCQVEIVPNGADAVAHFQAVKFDLVIMDMQMPVMDGWTATSEIRKFERAQRRSATPIIALTASALNEDRERCRAVGCTAFLSKPIRKADLIRGVHAALEPASAAVVTIPAPRSVRDPEIAALLPVFRQDVATSLAALRTALATGAYADIVAHAHPLIGSGTTFECPEVSAIGRSLEKAAGRQARDEIELLLAALEEQVRQLPA